MITRRVVKISESIDSIDPGRLLCAGSTNYREREAMSKSLKRALDVSLTQRQRLCLTMYYNDEMTMGQIAQELGVTESTVSRHIKAARKRLLIVRRLM